MSARSPDKPCARCGNEPRVSGYSYGRECRRAMQNERARRLAAQKKREALAPRLYRDACNCGDSTCNGMRCEVVRA